MDGYKVDANTMNGFRAWRAGACDRCHGANQEGLVGPSLIESLKTLSRENFKETVTKGRLEKGMPSFETSQPGIFAAGDVRKGSTKQVASAVGEGAGASIAIREYLKTV